MITRLIKIKIINIKFFSLINNKKINKREKKLIMKATLDPIENVKIVTNIKIKMLNSFLILLSFIINETKLIKFKNKILNTKELTCIKLISFGFKKQLNLKVLSIISSSFTFWNIS